MSEQDDLWQFPCQFTFKAMTEAISGIEDEIVTAIQQHAPGDYTANIRESRGGNYFSVTVSIHVSSKDQLDAIYRDVHALTGVKMLL